MTKSPKELLKLIQEAKNELKTNDVVLDMCKEYSFDIDDLDLIPVKFGDIDVSATTDAGVITLSYALLEKDPLDTIKSYLVHEIRHYLGQADKPTQSADDGDYLSNKDEQVAFQRQIEYIADESGKDKAEDYVEQVLDHHEEKGKERKEKEKILMKKVESMFDYFVFKTGEL